MIGKAKLQPKLFACPHFSPHFTLTILNRTGVVRLLGVLACSDWEQFLADSWRSGTVVSCTV